MIFFFLVKSPKSTSFWKYKHLSTKTNFLRFFSHYCGYQKFKFTERDTHKQKDRQKTNYVWKCKVSDISKPEFANKIFWKFRVNLILIFLNLVWIKLRRMKTNKIIMKWYYFRSYTTLKVVLLKYKARSNS